MHRCQCNESIHFKITKFETNHNTMRHTIIIQGLVALKPMHRQNKMAIHDLHVHTYNVISPFILLVQRVMENVKMYWLIFTGCSQKSQPLLNSS